MKFGKPVFIVESVETAVKFYTEKLGFDVFELAVKQENKNQLAYAEVRKGKCFIVFRAPHVGELAELSMIKACSGRGAGVSIEMKKGLEKLFDRCQKKGITIVSQPKKQPWGSVTFMIKDPFGFRLTFAQPIEEGVSEELKRDFCGLKLEDSDLKEGLEKGSSLAEKMISWLKGFGILRRVSKKYSKVWYKRFYGSKKK